MKKKIWCHTCGKGVWSDVIQHFILFLQILEVVIFVYSLRRGVVFIKPKGGVYTSCYDALQECSGNYKWISSLNGVCVDFIDMKHVLDRPHSACIT